jgi:4'-phosphopantetheinyl transferase
MDRKAEDFIERWVAKESVLKALGLGISEHLQAVSILAGAGEGYEITHDHPEWADIKAWPIGAPDGYAAALAMKSCGPLLSAPGIPAVPSVPRHGARRIRAIPENIMEIRLFSTQT